jgi:hypothetical protein
MVLASIPSPTSATWRLGPLSVRAYAVCVVAGIAVALVVASRRYRRSAGNMQGRRGVILDVAAWAVPFGLIGAAAHALLIATRHDFTHAHRLWHVVTLGSRPSGSPVRWRSVLPGPGSPAGVLARGDDPPRPPRRGMACRWVRSRARRRPP